MGGIAGIINFHGEPVLAGSVEAMTDSMDYRGPDGIEHWRDAGIALGHCRFLTTPESLQERQPTVSHDGSLVLVVDGRLDNWIELRGTLKKRNIALRNPSDAELLLAAYQLWGQDCLQYMEGDFALAIWHVKERRLFCARDRTGNKPFNYYWNGRTLVFASDLHAVLAADGVPQVPNQGVLAEYLAAQWYSCDETFWRGILRLVSAHCMTVDASGPVIQQYWSPDLLSTLSYSDDRQYIEHYRELFSRTVQRLSRSHLPISAEVSGGLDSSSIFAMAEHLRRSGSLAAPSLNGLTLNFDGDPDASEIEYARAVGQWLGTPIKEVLPARPSLNWYRERSEKLKDFPGYPNSTMAQNLTGLVKAGGSRVLLNGVGGDQWLGASRVSYLEEMTAGRWRKTLALLAHDIEDEGLSKSLWYFLRYGVGPTLPRFVKETVRRVRDTRIEGFDRRCWLSEQLRHELETQKRRGKDTSAGSMRWAGQRAELSCLKSASHALTHEAHEKLAATEGVELRRPFYDAAMIEFSFQVPKRLLYHRGVNRYAHREAMRGLLPEVVRNRQSKAEFTGTYTHYLSSMGTLLSRDIAALRSDWINPVESRLLYDRMGQGRYDGWSEYMLWVLFGCDALFAQT